MDIFAHSIWAAVAAKGANNAGNTTQERERISVSRAAFWGVFPDLFAFGIPFLVLVFLLLSGDIPWQFAWPGSAVVSERVPWIAEFIPVAYKISHSSIVFAAVFLTAWAITRRAPLAMCGWALHILIDIFSHAATFYPTPFLWPVSDWRFLYGMSWADSRFMIINYALMLAVFCFVFLRKKPISR